MSLRIARVRACGQYLWRAKHNCACAAELLFFVLIASTSIVSLNVSLMVNTVGIYQVSCQCSQHVPGLSCGTAFHVSLTHSSVNRTPDVVCE
jgi:hypothetical protein